MTIKIDAYFSRIKQMVYSFTLYSCVLYLSILKDEQVSIIVNKVTYTCKGNNCNHPLKLDIAKRV